MFVLYVSKVLHMILTGRHRKWVGLIFICLFENSEEVRKCLASEGNKNAHCDGYFECNHSTHPSISFGSSALLLVKIE